LPSIEYHLKQAKLAARLALVESDPRKAKALNVLALEHFGKADKGPGETPPSQLAIAETDHGMET
jgi:hypothetical protein